MKVQEESILEYLRDREQILHNILINKSPEYTELIKVRRMIENGRNENIEQSPKKLKTPNATNISENGNKSDKFIDSDKDRILFEILEEKKGVLKKKKVEEIAYQKYGQRITLRTAISRGREAKKLAYVKFGGSDRYAFVALAKWIGSDNGKEYLKKEFFPDLSSLPKNSNGEHSVTYEEKKASIKRLKLLKSSSI